MSKLTDQIMGKTQPDRVPLDVLLERLTEDLYAVFRVNGYKHIGFTLIAHSTDDGVSSACGNLKPDGIKALLEQCLYEMNKVEAPDQKELPN